jgi:cytochrome c-type biogenesis protein CcmH
MIAGFVILAAALAVASAALLLWPLVRRRDDGRPAGVITAIGVLSVLLVGSAALYAALSKYAWVEQPAVADSPAAMAAKLAKRLVGEPDNLDGWLMLGRSYTQLQQMELAIRAYQRADRLADGKNVEAVFGVADILVALDMEELRGRAGRLYERALELDPTSEKAMFYSAFAALGRGESAIARERFERILARNPREDLRALIQQGLARLDAPQDGASKAGANKPGVAASDARVSVRVTLAPALAAQVPKDAVLFVAARDPKAPGPPFAVKRLPAHFPVEVELSAADAMLESRRITAGQTLEIVARIALGGTPTASRGDPFGQVGYHVGKDGKLDIVIDQIAN